MARPTVPAFVRDLLEGDNLDEALVSTSNVMGIKPMNMLPDDACEEALRTIVQDLSSATTHVCIDVLKRATIIGGCNDPTMPGADLPWRAFIFYCLTLRQNITAERAARAWYRCLADAALVADPPYEHRAFAIYLAGVIEALLHNDHWSEHWLYCGQEEAIDLPGENWTTWS